MSKPKFTYHDTPKGVMRTERKTGKRKFLPDNPRPKRKKKK
jgi:hypothetical protein